MWNFKNPISFLGCCIWNLSKYIKRPLGKLAPYIFGIAIWKNAKKKGVKNA